MAVAIDACTRVFLSFPQVTDPARHPSYNAWHQLDHQPENLALPGVLHGDRWVRTPECRDASAVDADPVLSAGDYVAMYWFAEPADRSVAEWSELGRTTREQGRRPELDWTTRRMLGFFRPLGGRVADRVRVSAAALPFRAHRGVVVEVLRADRPASIETEATAARLHGEHLPAVLGVDGVAGSWTFASRDVRLFGDEPERLTEPGALQVAVHWCEADPVEVASALPSPVDESGLRTVLRTPLRTIRPWEWDWFNHE